MMMSKFLFCLIGLFFLCLLLAGSLVAQSWDLAREQDGVKVYTRQEAGKSLKAYKGTAIIRASAEKIFSLIEDVNHTDWWDKKINQIKVLQYEKNKRAQYYMVYNTPWPLINRDLCVDVTVNIDPVRSVYRISAVPLNGTFPEQEDRIRIKDYRQTWTVSPEGDSSAQLVLEGYLDPTGDIPVWLSNQLITQSPINAILEVKQRMENR